MVIKTVAKKILDKLTDGWVLVRSNENYAARNETQVIEYGTASNASTVEVYEVPAGKTLYITNAWITASGDDTTERKDARIYIAGFPRKYLGATRVWKEQTQALSLTYPMPIKVEAGVKIYIDAEANTFAAGGFSGWTE